MNAWSLNEKKTSALHRVIELLFDQERARVIVPPEQPAPGFWFGGGKVVAGLNGELLVSGRFRNVGDSRTGLGVGERGKELAIYRSTDGGESLEKVISLAKQDLNVGALEVISIEGSSLEVLPDGVRLYVSSEKRGIGYPEGFESFHKPGTGVWTIDVLNAPSLDDLASAKPRIALQSSRPEYLHVKDPFLFDLDGVHYMGFCTHPYSWASSSTGIARRAPDGTWTPLFDVFQRGPAWDVSMARGTSVFQVPRLGLFADESLSLMLYDGGECMRKLEEHGQARRRPRGYSCEELGGVAVIRSGETFSFERLSLNAPTMVSPWGTGSARYANVCFVDDRVYVTWQQSREDESQPLVMNTVNMRDIERALS
jgi:hypothetical protein